MCKFYRTVVCSWLLRRSSQAGASPEVTSLKDELKQNQLAYCMAVQMSQFKAGFLARTSHELRSPLSNLISLHQLILSDLCENRAEELEFLTQAHASALKLVKLLDEVVAVAKTQHGTNQLQCQHLQLSEVLNEVYQLTYLQAANHSLRLKLSLPDQEIYIIADPRWLRQVLVNLVDTAITLIEEGSIYFAAGVSPTSKYVHIWLDAEYPVDSWSEPVDLLQSMPPKEMGSFSPGMNLLVAQTIIEVMQGRLELLDASASLVPGIAPLPSTNFTRLQCTLPLATNLNPETALPE